MGALAVIALVGRMVLLFALLLLVPLGFALGTDDPAEGAFIKAGAITLACGLSMSVATRRFRRELQPRDGFLLVTLVWAVLPAFGTLPLLLAIPGLSFTDAYFETMSGLTTTGATVLTGLEKLPLSVNVWRCFMVLVGGMGIIVLVVAILPLMGVGATIDYEAGEVQRAPVWMRKIGLEWAYRVLSEPRRYGMRYDEGLLHLWRATLGVRGGNAPLSAAEQEAWVQPARRLPRGRPLGTARRERACVRRNRGASSRRGHTRRSIPGPADGDVQTKAAAKSRIATRLHIRRCRGGSTY